MSNFPSELKSEMWNSNVRFATILHIPTLTASSHLTISEEFQRFLDDAYSTNQKKRLLEQCPALSQVLQTIDEADTRSDIEAWSLDIASDLSNAVDDFEFLIELEMREPHNFKFKDGKFFSCSLGGVFYMHWILAKNMVEAAQLAIKIADENWEKECEKAKREQGIE